MTNRQTEHREFSREVTEEASRRKKSKAPEKLSAKLPQERPVVVAVKADKEMEEPTRTVENKKRKTQKRTQLFGDFTHSKSGLFSERSRGERNAYQANAERRIITDT